MRRRFVRPSVILAAVALISALIGGTNWGP